MEAARGAVAGTQLCPQDSLAQSWSQSHSDPNLPRSSAALSSFVQAAALTRQIHLPCTQDTRPGMDGGVTSWVKYLGCHGVWRLSRFRSSARCFSSKHRFCSVAASMSPRRRYRVTSRQRFLGTRGGEDRFRQEQQARSGQGREGGTWAGHLQGQ